MFVSVTIQISEDSITVGCMGQRETLPLQEGESKIVFTGEPDRKVTSKKRIRRAATKQERACAEKLGATHHRGSGAVRHRKGDSRKRGEFRVENKSTQGKGIRITREDLTKIRSECSPGEYPVYQISFLQPGTLRREEEWVMVPLDIWEKYAASRND